MPEQLKPKLFTLLREGVSGRQVLNDIIAGVIVGIVALPLAIAFAIASGVKPEQGLFTAIVAGFIISAFGGSRVQIGGPTGAYIVVVYSIVQQYGYEGLAVATFIAGLLLIGMGLARMGVLLRFIPYPLTAGFTSGIALIIFSSQIKDFFGLTMVKVPAEFVQKWTAYAGAANTFNPYALALGAGSLVLVFLWPRITMKVPGSLVAVVAGTLAAALFKLPVDTIGSRFGAVPNMLPAPHLLPLDWTLITKMFSPAVTIALLGAIESLLSAVVADGMTGFRHRSNMELIAQGLANVASPLFSGIPATGAIARTATNVKNGGRTPIAGITHAVTLLLIMLFFGHWAVLIPMPTLAAILIYVAYNMSEWHTFLQILRCPRGDIAVLLTTFFLTVLIDLTVAIEVGVVLAAFLFLQKMESVSGAEIITKDLEESGEDADDPGSISRRTVPVGVEVFEIYGPLFFGAVERFKRAMRRVEKAPRVFILRMRNVSAVDATGLQALEELLRGLTRNDQVLLLAHVREQPLAAMEKSGLAERIGRENILPGIDAALERATKLIGR